MKVFIDTLEKRYNRCLEYLQKEDLDDYKKKEFQGIIHNWPRSMESTLKDQDKIGHTRIETADGRPVRILAFRKDNHSDWPIIGLISEEDGSETLAEYNAYGYQNVKGKILDDEYHQLRIRTYYFEDGDYAASDSYYGILCSAAHSMFKFAISIHRDEELYGWTLDTPVRPCTQDEIDELNNKFDNEKWKKTWFNIY